MDRKFHQMSKAATAGGGFLFWMWLMMFAISWPAAAQELTWQDTQTAEPGAVQHIRCLADFEQALQHAPEVLVAAAELDESLGQLTQAEAESGWRVFAGAGAGQYREQVTEDYYRTYERFDVKAGLKYPILGARTREHEEVLRRRIVADEKAQAKELAIENSLLALRLQYINYWAVQEKAELAELFLRDEQEATMVLHERTATGLLLEADRLELMSAFDMTRRHLAQWHTIRQRAISALRFMTGLDTSGFKAAYPTLTAPCLDWNALASDIEQRHPRLAQLRQDVRKHLQLLQWAHSTPADAHLSVYSHLSTESSSDAPGYGLSIGIDVDFPLKLNQLSSARWRTARAGLEKSRRRLEIDRAQLLMDAGETLNGYRAAQKNCDFALKRVSAAQEKLREGLLRKAYLAGDTIEKLQQSRWDCYLAAVAVIDAFVQKLQLQAHLLSLSPMQSRAADAGQADADHPILPKDWLAMGGSLTGEAQSAGGPAAILARAVPGGEDFGVYVWDSERLLRQFANPSELFAELARWHIRRLLVSYTPAQIVALKSGEYRDQWRRLLESAGRHGVRVDLLLGEPSWMMPVYRPRLLEIIRDLADLPFQGVHLDLEPDQLQGTGQAEADLLEQLLDTVKAVQAMTPLAVGLSIHYRYLDPRRPDGGIGPALESLSVQEVALMIYKANPQRVAEVAGAIMRRYALNFAIAQSVEPILGRDESYNALSRARFLDQMQRLRTAIPEHRFTTVLIQSWSDFAGMQP